MVITDIQKVAYRPAEFGRAIGVCRATVYKLMQAGKLKSVKTAGGRHGARLIITTPAEYLATLKNSGDM
jgi:hypothetical protein